MQQLLLFEESEEEKNEKDLQKIKDKYEKLRKSIWAEYTFLKKEVDSLRAELQFLKYKFNGETLFH